MRSSCQNLRGLNRITRDQKSRSHWRRTCRSLVRPHAAPCRVLRRGVRAGPHHRRPHGDDPPRHRNLRSRRAVRHRPLQGIPQPISMNWWASAMPPAGHRARRINGEEGGGQMLPWYVGTPGMASIVRPLAESVRIHTGRSVHTIERLDKGWHVWFDDQTSVGPFNAVAVACPRPRRACCSAASTNSPQSAGARAHVAVLGADGPARRTRAARSGRVLGHVRGDPLDRAQQHQAGTQLARRKHRHPCVADLEPRNRGRRPGSRRRRAVGRGQPRARRCRRCGRRA